MMGNNVKKQQNGGLGGEMNQRVFPQRHQSAISLIVSIFLLASAFLCSSCGESDNRQELARRMATEEGRAEDDARIVELKGEIRSVDSQVEKTLQSVQESATFWRLLGLKYMDYKMWGKAMEAFNEALAITPEHSFLLYNRALCAGQQALAADSSAAKDSLMRRSEVGYRRALAVDPRYTPAMYALAVVLVFEKDRPGEAIPLLEDYLDIERSDIPSRFLLARSYLGIGMSSEALDLYDEIIALAENPADVRKAEDLYKRIVEGDYGS